jgi:3-oxoadipate enol-lactonase
MALHLIDRMAVEDEGVGDAVVCVHGLGGSSNTWTPLMPALARHRVLRIDLPGSGRSQTAEGALSMPRFVESLVTVCSRLGLTRAHWLGHSMGTIVCQHLAVAQPKLVRSLALFGPLAAPTDAARTGIRARAAKARSEGAAGMQSLMRQDAEAYARNCEALADAQPAEVSQCALPLLLVTGDEDGVAPPQAVRALAERFHAAKSTRVVVLPRCGHWTPIERPEECSRELRDFLAGQRS